MAAPGSGKHMNKLLISNLDPRFTDSVLKSMLFGVGEVEYYAVHYNLRGISEGTGEVNFKHRSDAIEAFKIFNNSPCFGRQLKCELADYVHPSSDGDMRREEQNGCGGSEAASNDEDKKKRFLAAAGSREGLHDCGRCEFHIDEDTRKRFMASLSSLFLTSSEREKQNGRGGSKAASNDEDKKKRFLAAAGSREGLHDCDRCEFRIDEDKRKRFMAGLSSLFLTSSEREKQNGRGGSDAASNDEGN